MSEQVRRTLGFLIAGAALWCVGLVAQQGDSAAPALGLLGVVGVVVSIGSLARIVYLLIRS